MPCMQKHGGCAMNTHSTSLLCMDKLDCSPVAKRGAPVDLMPRHVACPMPRHAAPASLACKGVVAIYAPQTGR